VETRGVYIQDVELPAELVTVLREREIAKQQQATFAQQEAAQRSRTSMEAAKGTADMQVQLTQAQVNVTIEKQKVALGPQATALLNLAEALGKIAGEIKVPLMPHTLITGGEGGALPVLSGVGSALMQFLEKKAGPEAEPGA
jgi:regulator of protease activity HflC (stomatin/prohibitin superfamily)